MLVAMGPLTLALTVAGVLQPVAYGAKTFGSLSETVGAKEGIVEKLAFVSVVKVTSGGQVTSGFSLSSMNVENKQDEDKRFVSVVVQFT